jgi:hypothetical protein
LANTELRQGIVTLFCVTAIGFIEKRLLLQLLGFTCRFKSTCFADERLLTSTGKSADLTGTGKAQLSSLSCTSLVLRHKICRSAETLRPNTSRRFTGNACRFSVSESFLHSLTRTTDSPRSASLLAYLIGCELPLPLNRRKRPLLYLGLVRVHVLLQALRAELTGLVLSDTLRRLQC